MKKTEGGNFLTESSQKIIYDEKKNYGFPVLTNLFYFVFFSIFRRFPTFCKLVFILG